MKGEPGWLKKPCRNLGHHRADVESVQTNSYGHEKHWAHGTVHSRGPFEPHHLWCPISWKKPSALASAQQIIVCLGASPASLGQQDHSP